MQQCANNMGEIKQTLSSTVPLSCAHVLPANAFSNDVEHELTDASEVSFSAACFRKGY